MCFIECTTLLNFSVIIMAWQMTHPFKIIISGPSGAGKSVWTKRFLKEISGLCDIEFDRIILYYAEWQPVYTEYKNVEFQEGLPDMKDFNDIKKKKLIIMDDLMRESSSGSSVLDIFTKGSHHRNLSVLLLSQNLFHGGKFYREISLNTNYIVVFKNPRDKAQISHLARQISPLNTKFIQEAYLDATSAPHGYLLIDLNQSTPENIRIRTCIFPSDPVNYVYVPKQVRDINTDPSLNLPVVHL